MRKQLVGIHKPSEAVSRHSWCL